MAGPEHPLRFQFLFAEEELAPELAAKLRLILQPPSEDSRLPGEGGKVWRTPKVTSPPPGSSSSPPGVGAPDLEFGDGVSAVFKHLAVSGPPSEATGPSVQSSAPPPPTLSANSTPFVPSIPLPYSGAPTPTIPIPIPNTLPGPMGPQHIHINNFTANLNYHGLHNNDPTPPQAGPVDPMVVGPQHMQYRMPRVPQQAYLPHHVPQQYQPQGMELAPGYTVAQGPDGQFYYIQVAPQSYPQQQQIGQHQRPRVQEFNAGGGVGVRQHPAQHGPGITFGSTPVVSVKKVVGGEDENSNQEEQGLGFHFGGDQHQASPHQHQASSHQHQASPQQHQASPHQHQANSHQHQASPHQHQASPHQQQLSSQTTSTYQVPQTDQANLVSRASDKSYTGAPDEQSPVSSKVVVSLQDQEVIQKQFVNTADEEVKETKEQFQSVPTQTKSQNECPQVITSLVPTHQSPPKVIKQPLATKPVEEAPDRSRCESSPSNEERQPKPILDQLPKMEEIIADAPTIAVDATKGPPDEAGKTKPDDVVPAAVPAPSWASLFSGKPGGQSGEVGREAGANKPTARIQPFSVDAGGPGEVGVEQGGSARQQELGLLLRDYQLKHISTALLPRGLTNRSNWCFVNAILQALLACPPFYNLIRSVPGSIGMAGGKSKTPMLDSMVEFFSEFSLLDLQLNKTMTGSGNKKDRGRKKEDIVTGVGLEPSYVYKMLLSLEDDTFKVVDGRQEDAEEFLTRLLNGLSDEMLGLIKLVAAQNEETVADTQENENEDDTDDWQEVGAKGRSCVTRRIVEANSGSSKQTPVQSLALGMWRSCVKAEGGENSATLQPFFTLQLDIQDSEVVSVTDALLANFASEQLDGFICAKTKKEVKATRSVSLEELPPILILHLKRFVYDGATGGVQKVMKQVGFDVDLEVPKTILSSECKTATGPKQRQYKLFSVVYHNGREATKGHYLTDVFHTGYGCWLHCDDSQVQPTSEQLVVQPGPTSTPYLLFYRRGDTMVGSNNDRASPGGREGGR